MAVVNLQVDPVLGPNGRPIKGTLEGGYSWAFVKITIPTGSVYATADQCALVHGSAKDFRSQYGATIVRQVVHSNGYFIPTASSFASGEAKGVWNATTQRMQLNRMGAGSAGPQDDLEVADATTLTGVMNDQALVFF